MSAATGKTTAGDRIPSQAVPPAVESALPELRAADWEVGIRRRAETGVFGVFAELPGLVREAAAISWRADRIRTLVVAVATVMAG